MNQELTTTSIESIISSFNEWERQAYEKLRNKIRNLARDEIKGRYELAQTVAEIVHDMKQNKTYYRSTFLRTVAICLGFKSDMPLREMLKVAERWPSWEDLEHDVLVQLPTNLRWKDIVFLSKAKNEEEYQQIIQDIQQQKPTALMAQQLQQQAEIDKEISSNQKGRKPKLPESYDELLLDVAKSCRQLIRKVQQAWMTFDLHQAITGILQNVDQVDESWKKLKNAYLKLERAIQSLHEYKRVLHDEATLFHAHVNDELPDEFDEEYDIVDVGQDDSDEEDSDLPRE